jgi:hypothetical protein
MIYKTLQSKLELGEKIEDTKEEILICKSKKYRQHNDQTQKDR